MKNVFELKSINQIYKNKDNSNFILFENLNLAIEDFENKGQFVVLMGESGCGKSTILRYLTGLQKPTNGEILINNEPLKTTDTIPMVFQNPSSLEWYSVLYNVALPLIIKGISKKEALLKAEEMLEIVGLKEHKDKYAKYPLLSGGQLQRVAIARSLVANPSMIVMDEPFSALDSVNRRKMQDFLLDMFKKAEQANLNPTIILVTHDSREAVYLADDIIIMGSKPGRIKEHIKTNFPNKQDLKVQKEYLELVTYLDNQI